jgi:isochorismatase family protein
VREEIGAIVDRVAPRPGEPTIVKNYPNSFTGTELDTVLKQGPERPLLLAGFMTHMCVNSTARGAFSLGYAPTVVAGATATRGPARRRRAGRRGRRVAGGEPGVDRGPVRRRGHGRAVGPGLKLVIHRWGPPQFAGGR